MNNPLVSVLIPCYNVSAYIQRAVDSILNQTYTNLEIWIIDDASTDDTLQKIQGYKDPRINIAAFQVNTQKVGAVNDVLKKVKGAFICFQDADDWSQPERILEQVNEFIQNPALGICFTGYKYFGDKIYIPERIAITNEELRDEFLEFGHKKNHSFTSTNCPTMMISREALEKTKGYHPYFKGRVAEDIQWVYRILKNYPGITINKPLYNYHSREGSFTQIQFAGKNAKYAYSWELLSKIIYKDVHENVDLLAEENFHELSKAELDACEEALVKQIQFTNMIRQSYEKSTSFRLGKFILNPLQLFKIFQKKK